MDDVVTEKLYPWTKLVRQEIEARIYCPKCGASKMIHGNDNPQFWETENRHPWLMCQCDKCRAFITIKKRPAGVTVQQ